MEGRIKKVFMGVSLFLDLELIDIIEKTLEKEHNQYTNIFNHECQYWRVAMSLKLCYRQRGKFLQKEKCPYGQILSIRNDVKETKFFMNKE
jgi:hypothetical protein